MIFGRIPEGKLTGAASGPNLALFRRHEREERLRSVTCWRISLLAFGWFNRFRFPHNASQSFCSLSFKTRSALRRLATRLV